MSQPVNSTKPTPKDSNYYGGYSLRRGPSITSRQTSSSRASVLPFANFNSDWMGPMLPSGVVNAVQPVPPPSAVSATSKAPEFYKGTPLKTSAPIQQPSVVVPSPQLFCPPLVPQVKSFTSFQHSFQDMWSPLSLPPAFVQHHDKTCPTTHTSSVPRGTIPIAAMSVASIPIPRKPEPQTTKSRMALRPIGADSDDELADFMHPPKALVPEKIAESQLGNVAPSFKQLVSMNSPKLSHDSLIFDPPLISNCYSSMSGKLFSVEEDDTETLRTIRETVTSLLSETDPDHFSSQPKKVENELVLCASRTHTSNGGDLTKDFLPS